MKYLIYCYMSLSAGLLQVQCKQHIGLGHADLIKWDFNKK